VSADTEALIATVREALKSEALHPDPKDWGGEMRDAWAALDSLAAELEKVEKLSALIVEQEAQYRDERKAAEAELERTQKIAEAHKGANKLLVDEYEAKLTAHVESMQAAEAELERVKAERDHLGKSAQDGWQAHADEEARLDKALSALREMSGYVRAHLAGHDADPELKWALEQSDAAIAEIEGEPAMVVAEREAILRGPDAPAAEIEGEA